MAENNRKIVDGREKEQQKKRVFRTFLKPSF